MSNKIISTLLIILLALQLFTSINTDASQPIGVAGFIYDEDGNPIPNHQVNITNVNKSITKTVTTNLNGLYAVSIEADNGDIIQGNFSYNGKLGLSQINANLNLVTNWLNISLVSKQIPVAKFIYKPSSPASSTIIEFTDLSYDPDGSIVRWKWDFGDDTTSTQRNPTHIYGREGKFKVTLMVMDNDGYWGSTWQYVRVLMTVATKQTM